MFQVEKSVIINKPVEQVFAFVTDARNDAKWQGGGEGIEVTGPSNAVGAQFTEVRKFMGRELRSTREVTAFEPNAKWAARVLKGPVPFTVTVTFEPSSAGTKMTTYVEGEPKGFFKIAEGMLKGQLEKSLEEDSKRLKGILEAT